MPLPEAANSAWASNKPSRKAVLAVSYVGTQNRHQSYYTETNLPPQSLLPGFVTDSAAAQTYNASVPYVGYNSVLMAQNEANGDYNSIQVSLRGATLKSDLTYQAGYTYSHTNDSFDGIPRAKGISTMLPTPTQDGNMTTGLLRSTFEAISSPTSSIAFRCSETAAIER